MQKLFSNEIYYSLNLISAKKDTLPLISNTLKNLCVNFETYRRGPLIGSTYSRSAHFTSARAQS